MLLYKVLTVNILEEIDGFSMNKMYDRKIVSILQVLQDNNKPMGSTKIAVNLQEMGFDLSERMVRFYRLKN